MSNPKPLYTITPEQEKATLHDVLKTKQYNKFLGKSLLLSDLAQMDEINQRDKFDVIGECLDKIIFNTLINDKDFDYSYKNCKSLYEKYANHDLFGAIGGLSLTADHLQQLKPQNINGASHYEILQIEYSFAEYDLVLTPCLFFDFSKNSDEFYKAFDRFLNYEDITGHFNFLLLLLQGNHFTEARVQQIVSTNQDTGDGGSMIFFAACPYTKNWLTKSNFIEKYKSIDEYCEFDPNYALKELTEAYRDLFNEEFVINTESF